MQKLYNLTYSRLFVSINQEIRNTTTTQHSTIMEYVTFIQVQDKLELNIQSVTQDFEQRH